MPKKKITDKKISNLAALEDKLKRSLADYSNLEKRMESQRQLFVTLATADIVCKMIDVLDDFRLAQTHLKDSGLQISIDKFKKVLADQGLTEIEAKGLEFNPESMDCVDVAEGKQDHIVSVRKIGYRLNNHIIRPVQVVVGRQTSNNN
jgi:molecular chaperone GrpE